MHRQKKRPSTHVLNVVLILSANIFVIEKKREVIEGTFVRVVNVEKDAFMDYLVRTM